MPWISVFGTLRRSKRVRSYFCPCREAPHPVGDFTRAVVCVMLVILVRASPVPQCIGARLALNRGILQHRIQTAKAPDLHCAGFSLLAARSRSMIKTA